MRLATFNLRRTRSSSASRQAFLAAVIVAVALGACGGDADSTNEPLPRLSLGLAPLRPFVERTANLLATTRDSADCRDIRRVNARSSVVLPCPAPAELRRSLSGFRFTGSQEFGSGAVVEYTSGDRPSGATIVLSVMPDRRWGIGQFGVPVAGTLGTDDRLARPRYGAAARALLAATARGDCRSLMRLLDLGKPSPRHCAEASTRTRTLRKHLSRAGDRLHYLGGNDTFGFFRLPGAHRRAPGMTLGFMRRGRRAIVAQLAYAPPQVDIDRVRREYRAFRKRSKIP